MQSNTASQGIEVGWTNPGGYATRMPHVVRGKLGASEEVLGQLTTWAARDQDRWEQRNQRFKRQQELYQLKKPANLNSRYTADITVLNDPKVIVQKVARLIARHPGIIDVPNRAGLNGIIAQKVENWLYAVDQGINQRWMLGLHNPYRYDQAFFQVLRGWGCTCTMLAPEGRDYMASDPSALFYQCIVDPADIYPASTTYEVTRVTHAYWSTVQELCDDPMFEDALEPWRYLDEAQKVQVKAIYWKDSGSWWHAVLSSMSVKGDSMWIKEPVELGYNPWTITLAGGPAYRRTPWDDLTYLEEIGSGVLEANEDIYAYLNKNATKLSELLSLETNPPVTVTLRGGQMKPIQFHPGARNFLLEREKIEPHRIGPNLQDYKLLWDILEQRAARAGLPAAFFAEYGGESGFSAAVLLAAGKDVLFPFTEAVNMQDSLVYRKMLEIYRDHGPSDPLSTYYTTPGDSTVFSAEILPAEIEMQGVFVKVTREDMTPQELAQRITLGLQMMEAKAISMETFRRDYAQIRNPEAENALVIGEAAYQNQEVMKALVGPANQASGHDQLRQVWEAMQNAVPPGAPAGPPGLPPGATGAAPGVGAPSDMMPQMPQPAGGMPGMPPVMPGAQTMNGAPVQQQLPPELAAMQQMMGNGGAIGGAGGGGVPPQGLPGLPPGLLQAMGAR